MMSRISLAQSQSGLEFSEETVDILWQQSESELDFSGRHGDAAGRTVASQQGGRRLDPGTPPSSVHAREVYWVL